MNLKRSSFVKLLCSECFDIVFSSKTPREEVETGILSTFITHERLKWKRQLMEPITAARARVRLSHTLAPFAATRSSRWIINDGESSRRSVFKVIKHSERLKFTDS